MKEEALWIDLLRTDCWDRFVGLAHWVWPPCEGSTTLLFLGGCRWQGTKVPWHGGGGLLVGFCTGWMCCKWTPSWNTIPPTPTESLILLGVKGLMVTVHMLNNLNNSASPQLYFCGEKIKTLSMITPKFFSFSDLDTIQTLTFCFFLTPWFLTHLHPDTFISLVRL